jgi:hypothetical protein
MEEEKQPRNKTIKIVFERATTDQSEIDRHVTRAFDILFSEVLRQIEAEKQLAKNYEQQQI